MPVQPTQRQRVVESFEEDVAPVVPTIVRPTRRHMPAAHFHGDTSKYALGVHQNYHGQYLFVCYAFTGQLFKRSS